MPTTPRWAVNDNEHPATSIAEVINHDWRLDASADDISLRNQGTRMVDLISNSSLETLTNAASVRYIAIPMQDTSNDDDFFTYYGQEREAYIRTLDKISWLKKVETGARGISLYENINYRPHISSQAQLFNVDNFSNLDKQLPYFKNTFKGDSSFSYEKATPPGAYGVQSLFTKPVINLKNTASIKQLADFKNIDATLYKNAGSMNLYYMATDNTVEFYTKQTDNLELSGKLIDSFGGVTTTKLLSIINARKQPLFLLLDQQMIPLKSNTTVNLGSVSNYKEAGLYTNGVNLIPVNSFENSLAENGVKDCNNYDDKGKIAYSFSSDSINKSRSLQLEATRHTACTDISFNVSPKTVNVLSFDYKSVSSRSAGYYLLFNDKNRTVYKDKINIKSTDWQKINRAIVAPEGSTSASLVLYSYESDGHNNNVVLYGNVSFATVKLEQPITLPKIVDKFVGKSLPLSSDNIFSINTPDIDMNNLIDNPSFENGFWEPAVGDCNNHDRQGLVAQHLDTTDFTDNKTSLVLEATRHIACTSKTINIPIAGDYSFSFDYKSLHSKQGGYNLQFNDQAATIVNQKLEDSGKEWQHINKVINVPSGATDVSLTIYAYESDGKVNNTVHYDNFRLSKIPDLNNTYYLVTKPTNQMTVPRELSFSAVNSTKQIVKIKAANDPFLLSFAESFDPGWKLYVKPISSITQCDSVAAFVPHYNYSLNQFNGGVKECRGHNKYGVKEDLRFLKTAPVFDNAHIKINGFANGWTVDPGYIKSHYGPEYYHQNGDGSLDLNMVVYFKPQSYFYIGLGVSIATFGGCLVYLGYPLMRGGLRRIPYKSKPGFKTREKHISSLS
ncbi:MAG: hypothetical protein NVS1B10_05620 [Candidatus Saccharimonadales bacterium]